MPSTAVRVLPHFPSSSSPPLILEMDFGENVSARRELDTLCGLSKWEKGDISEGRGEVRLLAELPHALRTRERCGERARSLELFLLLRIKPCVCVGGR